MPTPRTRRTRGIPILLQHIPARVRMSVIVAVLGVAGLAWQHHNPSATPAPSLTAPAPTRAVGGLGDHPDMQQRPAPTVAPQLASMDAARAVAQRFASNFATPTSNRDDWLSRISADTSTQLREQYQLTDIRTLNQAAVTSLAGPLDVLPGAAAFRASYSDGSQIQLYLELAFEGWKVVNVVPVH